MNIDFNLESINDEFNTTYFMSTSIYETTAYRFIRNNNIIWKINIPKSKFNKFYYSYLSSKKHYFNNSLAKNQQETEFLLKDLMRQKRKFLNHD